MYMDAYFGTDFTVNAVYYDLQTKVLEDPLGVAFQDFRKGILRQCDSIHPIEGITKYGSSLIRMVRLAS